MTQSTGYQNCLCGETPTICWQKWSAQCASWVGSDGGSLGPPTRSVPRLRGVPPLGGHGCPPVDRASAVCGTRTQFPLLKRSFPDEKNVPHYD